MKVEIDIEKSWKEYKNLHDFLRIRLENQIMKFPDSHLIYQCSKCNHREIKDVMKPLWLDSVIQTICEQIDIIQAKMTYEFKRRVCEGIGSYCVNELAISCKKCGCDNLNFVDIHIKSLDELGFPARKAIKCSGCGYTSSFAFDEFFALQKWNRDIKD